MNRILGKAVATLGGTALAAGALLATAAPANAAWDNCPKGYLCAYLGINGTGGNPGKVEGNNTNLTQYNKFRNADSIWNNGKSCNVRIYGKRNYTGAYWTLNRGAGVYNLNTVGNGGLKNGVHSNKWCV
ncbi:peptidase inhibitor family I36 protein [Streptomyces sp. PR69]|uniref:peptidase inhibitor family I36 protein n=1 Tax=Streptomyces sp. PR69 TaxID=2984950 RepID=UPI0022641CA6|nr:peptidase inhibitor family I36 protein [Streptomyces sp. PR69]